MAGSANDYFKD